MTTNKLSYSIGTATAVAIIAGAVFALNPADNNLATMQAPSINCDLSQYKAVPGLTAAIEQGTVAVTWTGTIWADTIEQWNGNATSQLTSCFLQNLPGGLMSVKSTHFREVDR